MTQKVAVILRGPPGAGKTPVADELRKRGRGTTGFARLDDFWCFGEKRFAGHCRYWDLADNADALIVELGYGEPSPEVFLGASRNPGEWLTVLEAAGREVFFFLLWIPLAEALKRKQGRMEPNDVQIAHRRYDEGGVCSQAVFLPRFAKAFSEVLIRTDQQGLEATVDQILGVVRSGLFT
jgi:hypothetical protein